MGVKLSCVALSLLEEKKRPKVVIYRGPKAKVTYSDPKVTYSDHSET